MKAQTELNRDPLDLAIPVGACCIFSTATIASDYFDALNRITKVLPQISSKAVVYGGASGSRG